MRASRAAFGVRTRSVSDGIEHSSCALIGSLPLAVLVQRCASARKPRGLRVRTRSGSDGIEHSSCALIGSLPLAVLTQRCARTVELTRRREFIQSAILNSQSAIRCSPPLASNDLLDNIGGQITSWLEHNL